jgi:hypothetical protein
VEAGDGWANNEGVRNEASFVTVTTLMYSEGLQGIDIFDSTIAGRRKSISGSCQEDSLAIGGHISNLKLMGTIRTVELMLSDHVGTRAITRMVS